MHRVLITGAGGGIGRSLRETLRGVYPVLRLSDRVRLAAARAGEEVDCAELSDLAAVERIVADVDGIIHLGGISGESELGGDPSIEHRRHIQPVRGSTTRPGQAHHRRHEQPCGRLLSARPDDRPSRGAAPGQPLRRQQSLRRGARQPLCRQARDRISVHPHRQFRAATDRQTPAFDLDQPTRLYPARAHRPRASRHPLRDRLRRLEQSALLVRQLQRRAARLPAAGRFRALCRGGTGRRACQAPTRSPSAIRAEPSAPPSTRPKPLRIRAPRAPLPAAGQAPPYGPRPQLGARR